MGTGLKFKKLNFDITIDYGGIPLLHIGFPKVVELWKYNLFDFGHRLSTVSYPLVDRHRHGIVI